jgi:hypothetical protein
MAGSYFGYDGPFPPWNDSLVHHYVFTLYAWRCRGCRWKACFTATQVRARWPAACWARPPSRAPTRSTTPAGRRTLRPGRIPNRPTPRDRAHPHPRAASRPDGLERHPAHPGPPRHRPGRHRPLAGRRLARGAGRCRHGRRHSSDLPGRATPPRPWPGRRPAVQPMPICASATSAFEGLSYAEIEERFPDDARRWRQREPGFGPGGGESLRFFRPAAWRLHPAGRAPPWPDHRRGGPRRRARLPVPRRAGHRAAGAAHLAAGQRHRSTGCSGRARASAWWAGTTAATWRPAPAQAWKRSPPEPAPSPRLPSPPAGVFGAASPRCRQAAAVAMRPRGVRCR